MESIISNFATGAVQVAHSQATALLAKHQAKPGDKLPLKELVKENDAAKPFALDPTGKNVFVSLDLFPIIDDADADLLTTEVGVPGAFTPSCSSQAPAYIEKYDEFKAKGVNEIFIITVNDAYVTKCVPKIFVHHSLTFRNTV
jgi:hypothetical protein